MNNSSLFNPPKFKPDYDSGVSWVNGGDFPEDGVLYLDVSGGAGGAYNGMVLYLRVGTTNIRNIYYETQYADSKTIPYPVLKGQNVYTTGGASSSGTFYPYK